MCCIGSMTPYEKEGADPTNCKKETTLNLYTVIFI